MSSLRKRLLVAGIIIGATAGNAFATLLNFDNLPAGAPLGPSYPTVPNGYGGLNWNGFSVANGTKFSADYGYYHSVVSGDNVAFNSFAHPTSIGLSSGVFNLNSAYLTFALNLNTPLNIQVEGFSGSKLLYNNTYTVYSSGPTLIDFNYLGVSQVMFIPSPSQQFAMDNLDVAVIPEAMNTLPLLAVAMLGMGVLQRKLRKIAA